MNSGFLTRVIGVRIDMPKRKTPSTREAVFLSLLVNGEKYGRELRDAFEKETSKKLPLGSLYVTLDRMEAKGFLKSRMGESLSERGGNRRKYYRILANGHAALADYQSIVSRMFGGLASG